MSRVRFRALGVLDAAVAQLPPAARRVWPLVEEDGSTYRTMALELDHSAASVNRCVVMTRREITNALLAYKAACEPEVHQWPAEVMDRRGEVAERATEVAERRAEVAA